MKTVFYKKHDDLLSKISSLLEEARNRIVREVDQTIVYTYWHIGREIVEFQQGGKEKAEYGESVVDFLSVELTKKFGKGFSYRNLYRMRNFYLMFPILTTVSSKFKSSSNWQTLSAEFKNLSWSHYVFLM